MRLIDRLQERLGKRAVERLWLSLAAALVGVGTGVGVAAFRGAIHVVHEASFGRLAPLLGHWGGKWTEAIIPVLGGAFVGLLVAFVIGPERHHGVAGIMESVAIDGGRLRYRRMPFKAIGAAFSIGTGASVGPEDPSVQIGASLGSFFGQRLHLGEERVRMLVAAGAAGGIAAAFGAPIAGVFFALEVILGDLAGTGVGLVLVTAVIAAFAAQATGGQETALQVAKYKIESAWELPLHLLLGLAVGPFAAIYVRTIDGARGYFERSPRPRWTRPMLAGAAVGLAAIWLPQVRGVDYEAVKGVLDGSAYSGEAAVSGVIAMLVVVGLAKLLLTSACIGAGFPGGVFAPGMFIGCMLGGAFGLGMSQAFPGLGLHAGAFAMSGMAAFLAATVHAPLTAILLVFEVTRDYGMVAAAMAAVALSLLGAKWIEPESVYSRALVRRGFRRTALSPIETERAVVHPGAVCDGRRVKDVAWPKGCVVARIRRGLDTVPAGGETVIRAGDEVVAVLDENVRDAYCALFHPPGDMTGPMPDLEIGP